MMKTRSQRIRQEKDGIPPSPPCQLPVTRRPARATRTVGSNSNAPARIAQVANTRVPRRTNKKVIGGPKQTRIFQDADLPQDDVEDIISEKTSPSPSNVHLRSSFSPSPRSPFIELAPATLNSAPVSAPILASAPTCGPFVPHGLIHMWVDPTLEDLASHRPKADPQIAMAIPSAFISEITARLGARQRPKLTSVIASQISLSPKAPQSSNKRKLSDDTEMSRPAQRARLNDPAPSTTLRKKKKGMFSRKPFEPLSQAQNPAFLWSPPTPSDNTIYGENPSRKVGQDQSKEQLLFPIPPQPILLSKPDSTDQTNDAEAVSSGESSGDPSGDEGEISGSDRHEHPIAVRSQIQTEPIPQTPTVNPWGLNSLLNSARSVTRYLPRFTSRLTAETGRSTTEMGRATTELSYAPVLEASDSAPYSNSNSNSNSNSTPQIQHHQNSAHTEPRDRTRSVAFTGIQSNTDTKQHRRQRQPKTPRKSYKSKSDIQASRNTMSKRTSLQAQTAAATEEAAQTAAKLRAREDAEMATKTGGKRKRLPSPDTIPNPPGCSYGMDLDYFGYDSTDEDEDEDKEEITPTKGRPNKSRRLSKPGDRTERSGDPKKARPYTGAYFPNSSPTYQGGNVFDEVSSTEKARAQAAAQKLVDTPRYEGLMRQARQMQQRPHPSSPKIEITNLEGTFSVPDPSSSDSDPETSPEGSASRRRTSQTSETSSATKGNAGHLTSKEVASPTAKGRVQSQILRAVVASPNNKDSTTPTSTDRVSESSKKGSVGSQTPKRVADASATRGILESTLKGNSILQPKEVSAGTKAATPQVKAPETWKQPPPPRPTPSHAALPSVTSAESEALAIQRKKALKHQPLKPSGLRESSRMSSPMTASEIGDDVSSKDSVVDTQKNPVVEGGTKAPAVRQETNNTNVGRNLYSPSKSVSAGKGLPVFNIYEEYRETVDPRVAALLNGTNVDSGSFGNMISHNIAGYTAKSPIKTQQVIKDVSTPTANRPRSKRSAYTIDPKVSDYINSKWTEKDEQDAAENFKVLYAKWLAEEEEEEL